ncbi:MAG: hypothetical protein Q7S61_05865 [bacterium]|nr:hypothetical protein [bacterium]
MQVAREEKKTMRKKAGIEEGEIVKAKLVGKTIVIEPRKEVGYRIFTPEQIKQWKKDDKLSPKLAKETEKYWDEAGLP